MVRGSNLSLLALLALLAAWPGRASAQVRGKIRVSSVIQGAEVLLDGVSVGKAPLEVVDIAPGAHQISAQLPGYARFVQRVRVQANSTAEVELILIPVSPAETVPSAPEQPEPAAPMIPKPVEQKRLTSNWWFWAAVGGVILIGSSVSLAVALDEDDFIPRGELEMSSTRDWQRF